MLQFPDHYSYYVSIWKGHDTNKHYQGWNCSHWHCLPPVGVPGVCAGSEASKEPLQEKTSEDKDWQSWLNAGLSFVTSDFVQMGERAELSIHTWTWKILLLPHYKEDKA